MDYAQLAKQARANLERKPAKAPGASTGVDPRAWLSEIGGTIGAIGGGLVGGPGGAAAGAAGGTALGKVLEQRVKGEAIKPRDLAIETGLSALFAGGPIKAGKGLLGIATGKGVKKAAEKTTGQVVKKGAKRGMADTAYRVSLGVDDIIPPSKATPKTIFSADKLVDEAARSGLKGTPQQMKRQIGNLYKKRLREYIDELSKVKKTFSVDDAQLKISQAIADALPADKKYLRELNRTLVSLKPFADKKGRLSAANLAKFKNNLNVSRAFQKSSGYLQSDYTAKELVDISIWSKIDDLVTQLSPKAKEKSLRMSRLYGLSEAVAGRAKVGMPEGITGIATALAKPGIISGTTRATQPLVARQVARRGGGEAVEGVVEQAGRQAVPVGSSLLRQALAVGTRGLLSPIPAVPEEQISITEDITGLGAEPTPPPIDPRLPRIITAIEQDIARTGGKNIKNIQTIAGLYGIDLTPIGLQPAGAKKTTIDAATKRALAGIRTGSGIVDELENLIGQAGGGAGRVGGGLLGVASKVGLAPEARTFTAARNAYISRLSRALGETGVLTDQDIDRAKMAVPDINDSPREVQLKLASLRRIINDAYNELQAQFQ